jgi:hypothetical protein
MMKGANIVPVSLGDHAAGCGLARMNLADEVPQHSEGAHRVVRLHAVPASRETFEANEVRW